MLVTVRVLDYVFVSFASSAAKTSAASEDYLHDFVSTCWHVVSIDTTIMQQMGVCLSVQGRVGRPEAKYVNVVLIQCGKPRLWINCFLMKAQFEIHSCTVYGRVEARITNHLFWFYYIADVEFTVGKKCIE